MIIAAVSLLVAYLAFGHRVHPLANLQSVLIAALVVGIGYTIYSEWLNTEVRKSWGYTELMPIMPWIGVGLSPVLQWVIVPALAMLAAGLRVRNGRPKAQSE